MMAPIATRKSPSANPFHAPLARPPADPHLQTNADLTLPARRTRRSLLDL